MSQSGKKGSTGNDEKASHAGPTALPPPPIDKEVYDEILGAAKEALAGETRARFGGKEAVTAVDGVIERIAELATEDPELAAKLTKAGVNGPFLGVGIALAAELAPLNERCPAGSAALRDHLAGRPAGGGAGRRRPWRDAGIGQRCGARAAAPLRCQGSRAGP